MANTIVQKTIDISGIPFVVEKRGDGKYYIVAIRVRTREFFFESTGLPVEFVDKITGTPGDGKINGIEEIEDFLENMPEGSKLSEELQVDDVQSDIEAALGFSLDETEQVETPSV
jgi:hypothetical protein